MEQVVGLDVGYGFVKVANTEKGYVFPSVVGIGHTRPSFAIKPSTSIMVDDLRVTIGNQTYFVGRSAIRHSRIAFRNLSITRKESDHLRVLILSSLSLLVTRQVND